MNSPDRILPPFAVVRFFSTFRRIHSPNLSGYGVIVEQRQSMHGHSIWRHFRWHSAPKGAADRRNSSS